uniref:Uncharacterized protein n=1 Tax=Arcella intermedia TaxID=1963864 RepID=A0A6B2LKU8_9EUKA
MDFNNIGDNGAKFIFQSLQSNSTLTSLKLFNNNIGNNGVKFITQSLQDNSTLTLLDIGSLKIRVSDELKEIVANLLKRNLSKKETDFQTILQFIQNDNEEEFKYFLNKKGYHLNMEDSMNKTILYFCLKFKSMNCLNWICREKLIITEKTLLQCWNLTTEISEEYTLYLINFFFSQSNF